MVWVALKLMGRPRKAIREGSAVEEVREVEEAERLNHDVTCSVLHAKGNDKSIIIWLRAGI